MISIDCLLAPSRMLLTWHTSLLKKYRNNMNKTSSPLSRISANLKRRCWSKTECWIHLAIHCYYWLTISSCLYVFISLLSLVSCPFLGPNFLDGVYVSHLLPFIFQSLQELLSLTSLVVWTFVVVAIVLLKLYCWDIHKGEMRKVLTASTSYS